VLDRAESRELDREMLERFAALEADSDERRVIRDALVEKHLPLVYFLARKFGNRGEPLDDLVQVGTIGLIKAIDRFELGRGFEFSTYASPTIIGEIKRHFRDKTWAIRVPRRLQELGAKVEKARSELNNELNRSPTPNEIALKLGITIEDVMEAMESQSAYFTVSLDGSSDEDSPALGDSLGSIDESLLQIEDHESLKPLIALLDERAKRVLFLRFFENKSQSEIAQELDLSQMHVSRILAKTLESLRMGLVQD